MFMSPSSLFEGNFFTFFVGLVDSKRKFFLDLATAFTADISSKKMNGHFDA